MNSPADVSFSLSSDNIKAVRDSDKVGCHRTSDFIHRRWIYPVRQVRFIKKALAFASAFPWSGVRESNPPVQLGKLTYYRCINPAGTDLLYTQIPAKAREFSAWTFAPVCAILKSEKG